MGIGQCLVLFSVGLQSLGKVLYGTFLAGISIPLFILLSFCLTAAVFLAIAKLRLPKAGRKHMVLLNIWTALSFVGFFFALTYLPPAIVASIEIGLSLLAAIAFAGMQNRNWPAAARFLVCGGIVAGCTLLAWNEITASMSDNDPVLVAAAVAAAAMTGVTSTLSATVSKGLASSGWSSASVLAHRFYLTIAIAALWLLTDPPAFAMPGESILVLIACIGAVGILMPLLFLQIALRRIEPLTVMICFAAQPILSFLISMPSPAYTWDMLTLCGVLIVTLFVGIDIASQSKAVPLRQKGRRRLAGARRVAAST